MKSLFKVLTNVRYKSNAIATIVVGQKYFRNSLLPA